MNTQALTARMPNKLVAWLPIAAGLLFIYVPTFVDLFHGIWQTDRNAHGPIVLGVSLWFLGFRIRQMLAARQISYQPATVPGWCLLGFGLTCYVLGRSQGVHVLEVGSLIPILAGCVAMFFGVRALSKLWFSFFFMLFFIPLPASVVDTLTQPLKIGVSYATEHLLYWLGYPIARSGVILNIGQYQLLVADACAGLHSLFTLEALGLLYMNLVGHQSASRNALLGALIVPISFTSNVLRVITLTLITYYMGDAAGQGFLHGFAGMLLFLSALMMIIGVDTLLGRLLDEPSPALAMRTPATPTSTSTSTGSSPAPVAASPAQRPAAASRWDAYSVLGIKPLPALFIAAAMLAAAVSARTMTPNFRFETVIPNLDGMVPARFGDWSEVASPYLQVDLATGDDLTFEKPYEALLMRTYVNGAGERVMLALAYARRQTQDIRMHRPEACYEAQGFQIVDYKHADLRVVRGPEPIPGVRLLTRNRDRVEAVSYWIRVGATFPQGAFQTRWDTFQLGLAGQIPDGMLVRVSTIGGAEGPNNASYGVHEKFLADLVNALKPEARQLLIAKS